MRYWAILVFMVLSLFGALRLQGSMTAYAGVQTVLLIGATAFGFLTVLVLLASTFGGSLLGLLFFGGGLLNTLVIALWGTPSQMLVGLTLVVEALGFVTALTGLGHEQAQAPQPSSPVEVYDVGKNGSTSKPSEQSTAVRARRGQKPKKR